MKRVNKVLILFAILFSSTFLLIWKGLQTPQFAEFISEKLKTTIEKKAGLRVTFKKIETSLLPPSTILRSVQVYDLNEERVVVVGDKIGASFGFFDLFSRELSVGELFIEEGEVFVEDNITRPNEKKRDVNLKKIFSDYQEKVLKKLPIRVKNLRLEKVTINIGDLVTKVNSSQIGLYPNILTLAVDLSQPNFLTLLNERIPQVDKLSLDLQLTDTNLRLKSLEVFHELNSFLVKGTYNYLKEKDGVDLLLNFKGDLDPYRKILKTLKIDPFDQSNGYFEFLANLKGSLKDPRFNVHARGANIETEYFKLDDASVDAKLLDETIVVEKVSVEVNGGQAATQNKFPIFNIKEKTLIIPSFNVETNSLHTNDILYFLPELDVLKTRIDGEFKVQFSKNDVVLSPLKKALAKNVKLLSSAGKVILGNSKLFLNPRSKIKVNYDGLVNLDADLEFDDSFISAFGTIGEGQIEVNLVNSFANLEKLGPISGFQMKGRGPFSAKIRGPFEDVRFLFDAKVENFGFLDLEFGKLEGLIEYSIEKESLLLENIKANYASTDYTGEGIIVFSGDNNLNLDIKVLKGSVNDLKKMLSPIAKPIEPILKYGDMSLKGNFKLFGGFDIAKMKVLGKIEGENLIYLNEDFEKVNTSFSLSDEIIRLNNIRVNKLQGSIIGQFTYDLREDYYEYTTQLSLLRLENFNFYRLLNLGLKGSLSGEMYGSGESGKLSTRSHLKISDSSIDKLKVSDSFITIYNKGMNVYSSGKFLGETASFDSYVNLVDKRGKQDSYLKGLIRTKQVKILLGLISKHNVDYPGNMGSFGANIDLKFNANSWKTLTGKARVFDFDISRDNINAKISKPIEIEIEKGQLKSWDANINGNGLKFRSLGKGNFNKRFKIETSFEVDSSVLEVFTPKIVQSRGTMKGNISSIGNSGKVQTYAVSSSENMEIRIKEVPGGLKDFKYKLFIDDDKLLIDYAEGFYGGGKVSIEGSAVVKFPFPGLNLKFKLDRNRINYMKRSNFVVSGDLSLTGNRIPYLLKGDFSLLHGEVLDEMDEIAKSASNADSYSRFIPSGYIEGNIQLIKNDINLTLFKPIKIKNGLADLELAGNCKITGSLTAPLLKGEFLIPDLDSKFIFKGHEFILNEGRIGLIDTDRKESPEVKFLGIAKINEYDVYVNVNGRAENLQVELTSSPALSQSDILSLLTQGVTSDVYKNLGERERASVATLSIGTLIVDQLKINQNLNDSLGLSLSVAPEIEEEGENLLGGRVEEASSSSNVKSATKIQLKKKVNRNVDVGFSSTVGGTIDQKQEMNLNYKFDKNFSTELIYEVKSSDEEETDNSNSFGLDLKWKTSW